MMHGNIMSPCRMFTVVMVLVFALEFYIPGLIQAQSAAIPLHLGAALPDVVGQSLTGSPTHLSTIVAGKFAVVVFSFSEAGGRDTQIWDKQLVTDFGSNRSLALSTVIMLESAPRLFRGMIVSRLKKEMTPSLHSTTIVSYEEEKLLKQRLAVTDDSHAYVLLLGPDGCIRWRNAGAFRDAEYRELRIAIQQQFRSANP